MDGNTLAMPRYCSPSTIHTEQYIIMSVFSKIMMADYIRSLENICFRTWFTDLCHSEQYVNCILVCIYTCSICSSWMWNKKKHVHTICVDFETSDFHQMLLSNKENEENCRCHICSNPLVLKALELGYVCFHESEHLLVSIFCGKDYNSGLIDR